MVRISSITVHPEIQDGAPVFSGTRIPVETFMDFMRVGVSVREFLNEFPSVAPDQAMEVYELLEKQHCSLDQMRSYAAGPDIFSHSPSGRILSASY